MTESEETGDAARGGGGDSLLLLWRGELLEGAEAAGIVVVVVMIMGYRYKIRWRVSKTYIVCKV